MRKFRNQRGAICWLLIMMFFILLLGIKTSSAQPVNPANEEELRYRGKQQAEEQKRKEQQKDIFLQGKSKEDNNISLPEEKLMFPILRIQLEGAMSEQFPWAQEMLHQYDNRSIGPEGTKLIVKRLLDAFIARGYVTTRISIPEQDISGGILKLMVIPGRIGKIQIVGEKSDNWRTAFPMDIGDILNIRNLEQGLEQMKRLPSQDVNLQIIPGEKTGDSNIIITVKHSNNSRGQLSIDDSGQKETGKLQSSTIISLDNLLHINDMFELRVSHDLDNNSAEKGTRGSSIGYSFPYGNWTFSLNKNVYNYHQKIQGDTQTMQYSGKIDNLEFRAQRLLNRDGQSKTSAQFRITKKHSTNYLNDTEIVVQRKEITVADLALSHRRYYGQTVLDVDLAYRLGVPWFNAQPDIAGMPTTRYKLWTFDTQFGTPVKVGIIQSWYSCHIHAQYTKNVLYATDFFNIGDRYSVRGFDGKQTLASETGWYIRNELSIPIKGKEAYIGLDYGQVSGTSASSLPGKRLAGAVLGLRGEMKGVLYDVFAGWPLYKPQNYQAANVCYGFQLNYSIW